MSIRHLIALSVILFAGVAAQAKLVTLTKGTVSYVIDSDRIISIEPRLRWESNSGGGLFGPGTTYSRPAPEWEHLYHSRSDGVIITLMLPPSAPVTQVATGGAALIAAGDARNDAPSAVRTVILMDWTVNEVVKQLNIQSFQP